MLGALRHRNSKIEAKGAAVESPVDTSTMSFTGKIANWSAVRRWWVISAAVLVIAMSIALPGQLETKMYEGDGGVLAVNRNGTES
ncbi:MAG: hypothetical protein QF744_17030 [SAR202 cluster bacterium]|jgi:hypothetical protein|nr:hypothetical protein [SAR202 cluster bacterium]MDP6801513.1 hypothetical protein [SAR202 cluster bacterium]|tara:strand:+ start:3974 stop:4228 length:255 start_codon:yes stop_codon:yes gene_type:complete